VKHLRPYQQKALQECWEALKTNDEPVLLYASVGAGKSLMLSELLLKFEHSHKRALCIVNNAELVRNNAETYRQQGGNPSLYCNALNIKDTSQCVIFGTPQSVLNGK
jgi:DNA repair protein RadD